MEINSEIINKAEKCQKNQKCLINEKIVYCKVERIICNDVLILKCKEQIDCNFQISFGDCLICRCPVRTEIYKKYNL